MTQNFLELTTGERLSPNFMDKLRQYVLMRKFNCNSSKTTTDILLRLLEEDEDFYASHILVLAMNHPIYLKLEKGAKNQIKYKMFNQPELRNPNLNQT